MKQINYRLPIFGDQKIQLRAESGQLFKWLERHNEIRKLMNLDQLGVLKRRFSCAHHSKYEYAIMLIHLIEMIQQDEDLKYKYGISRPYEEKGKRILSSIAELLKCWALILPLGHVHGTFPHEKAILRLLIMKKEIYSDFLSRFENYPKLQEKAKLVIANDDYYKLHQLLALLKLLDYRTSKRRKDIKKYDKAFVNKHIRYIGYYINPTKEIFQRAKSIFSELRKIVYVLLDSFYCNLLFSFNSSHISKQTIKASLHGNDGGNYLSELWNSLDAFLMQELYKNTESRFIENLAYRAFFTRMDRENKKVNFFINLLEQPDSSYAEKTFNEYLTKHKVDLHQDHKYREVLHLSISGLRLFDIETRLDEARCAVNRNSKVAYLNYVIDKNIKTQVNDVHIYLTQENRIKTSPLIVDHLIKLCLRLCIASQKHRKETFPLDVRKYLKIIDESSAIYYSALSAGNWNKLILFVLSVVLKSKYSLRPVPIHKTMPNAILLDKNVIKKLVFAASKNREFTDLLQLAANIYEKEQRSHFKNKIIIYPFNIKICAKANKVEQGDIDSVLVNFVPNQHIELYLLQSKAKGQRYQEARKQAVKIKKILIGRLNTKVLADIFRHPNKSKTAVLKVTL